jgi:hypothetical protein
MRGWRERERETNEVRVRQEQTKGPRCNQLYSPAEENDYLHCV